MANPWFSHKWSISRLWKFSRTLFWDSAARFVFLKSSSDSNHEWSPTASLTVYFLVDRKTFHISLARGNPFLSFKIVNFGQQTPKNFALRTTFRNFLFKYLLLLHENFQNRPFAETKNFVEAVNGLPKSGMLSHHWFLPSRIKIKSLEMVWIPHLPISSSERKHDEKPGQHRNDLAQSSQR